MTGQFWDALCRGADDADRPFVDALAIGQGLGMNDTDVIAAIEALEQGNLVTDVQREGGIAVRLTEEGRNKCTDPTTS